MAAYTEPEQYAWGHNSFQDVPTIETNKLVQCPVCNICKNIVHLLCPRKVFSAERALMSELDINKKKSRL